MDMVATAMCSAFHPTQRASGAAVDGPAQALDVFYPIRDEYR